MLGFMLQIFSRRKCINYPGYKNRTEISSDTTQTNNFLITQNNCLHIPSFLKKKSIFKCFLIDGFVSQKCVPSETENVSEIESLGEKMGWRADCF